MREIVLGRNARIWQEIARQPGVASRFQHALGHADLATFRFTEHDRVWVFAYSRLPEDNARMIRTLHEAGVAEWVYVTSSSTIVDSITKCYEYPRAKKQAEDLARTLPRSKVLVLGLVVNEDSELPAGRNAATTIGEIARFMLDPAWPSEQGRAQTLFRLVERPFRSPLERMLHQLYGRLLAATGHHPCLLRPLDFVLRAFGMRWYGYTYLSNQLWSRSMTS